MKSRGTSTGLFHRLRATLLPDPIGKQAIIDYFRGLLSLARAHNTGYKEYCLNNHP